MPFQIFIRLINLSIFALAILSGVLPTSLVAQTDMQSGMGGMMMCPMGQMMHGPWGMVAGILVVLLVVAAIVALFSLALFLWKRSNGSGQRLT